MLRPVRFSAWHPLDDAGRAAPAAPGILQIRAASVMAYPQGRSAMVFYDAAAPHTLAEHVAASPGRAGLDRARAQGGTYVRFAPTGPEAAARELQRLLHDFGARFGRWPIANETRTDPREATRSP